MQQDLALVRVIIRLVLALRVNAMVRQYAIKFVLSILCHRFRFSLLSV